MMTYNSAQLYSENENTVELPMYICHRIIYIFKNFEANLQIVLTPMLQEIK